MMSGVAMCLAIDGSGMQRSAHLDALRGVAKCLQCTREVADANSSDRMRAYCASSSTAPFPAGWIQLNTLRKYCREKEKQDYVTVIKRHLKK
jgi:hypothetical protein